MKRYLFALLLFGTLAGCASSSNQDKTSFCAASQKTLTSYYWQLQEAKDAQGSPISALFVQTDKPVQIEFNDRYFNVSNTCNNMGGSYSLNDKELIFDAVFSTKKLCDDKLSALDAEISERLQHALSYSMTSDKEKNLLTLTTAKGDTLKFMGIPTPETRFNSKGEIIFLEIAPQKTPCQKLDASDKTCLQVRQVYYDDKGLKTQKPDAWKDFDQDIEGFHFQPGIRNILRVKKFTSTNTSAKTSDTTYALDMVVETEYVKLKR